MFSHFFMGVSNFERAYPFYKELMKNLQIEARFYDPNRPWAGWQSTPGPRPLFVIAKPNDGKAHHSGNGQMVAFVAKDRATVDLCYQKAIDFGGKTEGEPGLRAEYHEHYYGAYFRDLDGNKICVVCHEPT